MGCCEQKEGPGLLGADTTLTAPVQCSSWRGERTTQSPMQRQEEGCSAPVGITLNTGVQEGPRFVALCSWFGSWDWGREPNSHSPVVHGTPMSGQGVCLSSPSRVSPCPGIRAVSTQKWKERLRVAGRVEPQEPWSWALGSEGAEHKG